MWRSSTAIEPVIDHHLVQAIQELRAEVGVERVLHGFLARLLALGRVQIPAIFDRGELGGADVAGQDHDRVLEVDGAALAVGEPTVVEQLQQRVEHVRVRLLDLVEQDHGVRPAAHRLGQLPAFVVADVAGRRADQPRNGVVLHVFAHVDANHRALVVEQELGQARERFGLADTRGTQKQERADRALVVTQARARAAHGVGHRDQRVSCPITRLRRLSSMWSSFCFSPSSILETGTPVHLETIAAMSSSVTSSFR